MKLLGVTIQEHLKWNDHVREVLKATYGTLRALRQIKRMTPFRLRKNLAESLILTRIDYAVTLYGNNLQEYLKHRIQKVINSAAGYVYNRYSKQIDVVNLKWLPFDERIAFYTVKLAFKAINDPNWPKYLPVVCKRPLKKLRNQPNEVFSIAPGKNEKSLVNNMSKHYNDLPLNIRKLTDINRFNTESKTYFIDRALSKSLTF